ncbi:MAG: hypothetical protein JJU00_09990 [Opitutales bacterium]|nr:hypothetical protein [Opitutales bacterium]
MAGRVELSVAGGILGSEDARVVRKGHSSFAVELASSRGLPACPNMLQFQLFGAAAAAVEVEVSFAHPQPKGLFDEYHHAATPDFETFRLLAWEAAPNGHSNRLHIPATGWDSFAVGMQLPMPNEVLSTFVARWARHPDVRVDTLGYSLFGRPIWRVTVGGHPGASPRWRHCVANFHPGEGNARWRLAGMVEWLLGEHAAGARRDGVVEFFPLLSPDGPANGWRRVNAEGVDMNRCFRMEGARPGEQTHEAYLFQKHMEAAQAADDPYHTLWCLHTWPGRVEPLMDGLGPEFGPDGADFGTFRDLLADADTSGRIEPVGIRAEPGMETSWNGGAYRRFGMTSALVEGGGDAWPVADHLQSGRDLMAAITRFWTRERFNKTGPCVGAVSALEHT